MRRFLFLIFMNSGSPNNQEVSQWSMQLIDAILQRDGLAAQQLIQQAPYEVEDNRLFGVISSGEDDAIELILININGEQLDEGYVIREGQKIDMLNLHIDSD